jgi:hypothetical protein
MGLDLVLGDLLLKGDYSFGERPDEPYAIKQS